MSAHIENGRIERTMLGFEDHGILTFQLTLAFAGSGQGFGGWALDGRPQGARDRQPSAVCGAMVAAILRAIGVDRWEDLQGKVIRVRRAEPFGRIVAIGHILEDRWFSPEAVAAEVHG